MRHPAARTLRRLAEGLRHLGAGCGLWQLQLWTFQLDDLRIHGLAIAVALARCEWAAGLYAAAPTDADPETNKEAISKARIRP